MMARRFPLTYCIFIISVGGYCQSDFDYNWTNPTYDSLIVKADSAFEKADFTTSHIDYNSAFELRPTNYAFRLKEISAKLYSQPIDSSVSDDQNKYTAVINVADSLYYLGQECDALRLYYIAKTLTREKHPDEMLLKIHHPIHCDEIDEDYYKVVKAADKYFQNGNLNKAKAIYERALIFNKYETYPKEQLKLINNK